MASTDRQSSEAERGASAAYTRKEDPQLTGTALRYDLHGETRELQREDTWTRTGQNAKTLVKHPDFRIVLITMREGARIREHETGARVSIHCVSGRIRLALPDGTVELGPGCLLALDKTTSHDVEAIEESALLLSISWPKIAAPAS